MNERGLGLDEVAARITDYLAAHPHAVDTVRGIREWWLGATDVRPGHDEVRAVLDWLVGRGRVATQELPDGQRVYLGVGQGDARGDPGVR